MGRAIIEFPWADRTVDLVIPRGGEGLKAALMEHATVPVIYAASGNCHVYVDASADLGDARAMAAAPDAVIIDSGSHGIDEMVSEALALCTAAGIGAPGPPR